MLDKYSLDGFGVLPRRHETEEEYIERGNEMLNNSCKDRDMLFAKKEAGIEKILNSVNESLLEKCAQKIRRMYSMDLSWISVYHLDSMKGFSGIALNPEKVEGEYVPPFAVVNDLNEKVITHELVHCARFPIFPAVGYEKNTYFEEAMASLHFNWMNRIALKKGIKRELKAIEKAGENLENVLKADARKLIVRLTRWEVYLLAQSFQKFYFYIKFQNSKFQDRVRFGIILDKYINS